MQQTKICLVYPDTMALPEFFNAATNITSRSEKTLPPLGVLYIIGNSAQNIDFIDNRVKRYTDEKLYDILKNYDVVGFSGTIFEIKQARSLSRKLMGIGKTTLYGGPNATVNWGKYINDFNVIFRGAADLVFDKVLENLNDLAKFGFAKHGLTYVNPEPFRVEQLDALKYPAREKIDINEYRRKESAYLGDIYPVDTICSSRGCPFDCYFCSSCVIWGRQYICRSVDSVIGEISYMKRRYGTRGIYFREDNFTSNKARLLEFCKKIKDQNISWMCESRADTLDQDTVRQMAGAGCRAIWFGIESTDDVILRKIGKNITMKQIEKTLDICSREGIKTGGGFMMGFPFDDKHSIEENYRKSQKMNLDVKFYNRVWAVPDSAMYREIIEDKLDEYSFENIVLPATRYLRASEVNEIYYKLVVRKGLWKKKIKKILGENIVKLIRKYLRPKSKRK
ncbi:MAG TPA: radical SAM protein [Candidatus Omnitrophota bacterium]|nr:radical SAM protein [Candidatus Omnitrophota bacterium]